jgi:hypothetical protein
MIESWGDDKVGVPDTPWRLRHSDLRALVQPQRPLT